MKTKKKTKTKKNRKNLTKQKKFSNYIIGGNFGKCSMKWKMFGKRIKIKRFGNQYLIEGYDNINIKRGNKI